MNDRFRRLSRLVSELIGSPMAFLLAVALISLWAATGVLFEFSNTWQLIINTGTTIATFLIVFLIQNTQNRDAKAINLKLDELLRALSHARNTLVDIEDLSDEEIDRLEAEFRNVSDRAHHIAEKRRRRTIS